MDGGHAGAGESGALTRYRLPTAITSENTSEQSHTKGQAF
jgi:hypothetical protein